MRKFFSASTGGFYADDVHDADAIPDDAKEVSDAIYEALFAAQSDGKVISIDGVGNPIAIDPPAPTAEQIAAARVNDAKQALQASDMVALRCLKSGVTFPAEWQTYCVDLRAVVDGSSDTLPTMPEYPAGT